ncbi:MAG: YkgJ family cysteine cluster protein [Desulfobacterales bacterium]
MDLSKKCKACKGACCRYITVKLSAPRTIRDFDGLLWQVYHENVEIFKDAKGWHLLINNPCVHLNDRGRCDIYDKRPITCREHSAENCEYGNSIADTALLFFPNHRSLEKYCRKRFKTWDKR